MNENNNPCKNVETGCPFLDEAQMNKVAERAAGKAVEKLTDHLYREVGKSVIEKLFYVVGISAVALYLWLQHKGVV